MVQFLCLNTLKVCKSTCIALKLLTDHTVFPQRYELDLCLKCRLFFDLLAFHEGLRCATLYLSVLRGSYVTRVQPYF